MQRNANTKTGMRSVLLFVAFTGRWSDEKKGRDNLHRQYFFSLGPIVEIAVLKLWKKNVQIGRFVQRVSYF